MIVYKYDTETKEFLEELKINEAYGTNLPFTTTIKLLAKKDGFAVIFNGAKWEYVEDNRNTVVYNKETKQESKIDYLGKIKEDVTISKPEQFDKWDYTQNKWVEDERIKKETEYQNWKTERQNKVDNLEITHNDIIYQGDETSQIRMSRAISVMNDTETTEWVAKDNSIQILNKSDLSDILKEAGIRQTQIWNEGRPQREKAMNLNLVTILDDNGII